MHSYGIISKFDHLSLREKVMLYVLPLIFFSYIWYELQFHMQKNRTPVDQHLQLLESSIKNKKTFYFPTINELEMLAAGKVQINSIAHLQNMIKIDAQGEYQNILQFMHTLEQKHMILKKVELSIKNDRLMLHLQINEPVNQ